MTKQVLKIICDTYFKIRPVLVIELSDQEKQFVQAESIFEVISYFEEGEHYKFVLKVSISGLDTWFVSKNHVEIFQTQTFSLQHQNPTVSAPHLNTSAPLPQTSETPNSGTVYISAPLPQTSKTIDAELQKLGLGKVLFDTPHQMKVGVSERVSIRITKNITQDFLKGLSHSQEAEVENIRTSRFMAASLRGDDFKVEALSNEEQIIEDNDFTQWHWKVLPLKGGTRKLWVSITIQVKAENEQARKTLPILEKGINVKINPFYSTSTFVSQNWQWLIASAIIPIAGLILSKK